MSYWKHSGEEKSLANILTQLPGQAEGTIALFADDMLSSYGQLEMTAQQEALLLDLRIWGKGWELYACRGSVGDPFSWRLAQDEERQPEEKLESVQYLDIDSKKTTAPGQLCTTGGRAYTLPIQNEIAARVITYLAYDEDDCAQIVDHRLVGFLTKQQVEEFETEKSELEV